MYSKSNNEIHKWLWLLRYLSETDLFEEEKLAATIEIHQPWEQEGESQTRPVMELKEFTDSVRNANHKASSYLCLKL